MSGNDGRTVAPDGQDESDKKPEELTEDQWRRLEGRLRCGAIYGADIEYLYGTSEKTTAEWEYGGLVPFRPGTLSYLYRVTDVEKYFDAKQTFTRAERDAERKAKAKEKNEKKEG